MWHTFQDCSVEESKEIRATIRVGQESPWFSGHFPGNPALPGIAQLSMVWNLLEKVGPVGIKPLEIRKTKFMRIVRPGDPLQVLVRPSGRDPGTYEFEIRVKDDVSCKGIFKTRADE